jgi:hypothetical protein
MSSKKQSTRQRAIEAWIIKKSVEMNCVGPVPNPELSFVGSLLSTNCSLDSTIKSFERVVEILRQVEREER